MVTPPPGSKRIAATIKKDQWKFMAKGVKKHPASRVVLKNRLGKAAYFEEKRSNGEGYTVGGRSEAEEKNANLRL